MQESPREDWTREGKNQGMMGLRGPVGCFDAGVAGAGQESHGTWNYQTSQKSQGRWHEDPQLSRKGTENKKRARRREQRTKKENEHGKRQTKRKYCSWRKRQLAVWMLWEDSNQERQCLDTGRSEAVSNWDGRGWESRSQAILFNHNTIA